MVQSTSRERGGKRFFFSKQEKNDYTALYPIIAIHIVALLIAGSFIVAMLVRFFFAC